MDRAASLLLISISFTFAATAQAGERGLLWRVVQTCIANHNLTGAAFPCLQVDIDGDDAKEGYAVLRAPFENTHIIVTPTVRTIGIEAERLRGPGAPAYFKDAWGARHFVTSTIGRTLARDDLALAVNSRVGRSQDQLHIHVDCLRRDVKDALATQRHAIKPHGWTKVSIHPDAPSYWASALASQDLADTNVFDLVANGLHVDRAQMADITIVAAGAELANGKPGFILLARQRRPIRGDIAHGEALLDHNCSAYR